MQSKFSPIEHFLVSHVALFLRLAGLVSIASGLIGGFFSMANLADREDGDALRWGFLHNPFMQFPPFNEPFLDFSLLVMFACSAAVGLGGLMLLIPYKWGIPLVIWQARGSIIINGVIAFFIVATMIVFKKNQIDQWHLGGTYTALILRLGSIAVDMMLWAFLGSKIVSEFWNRKSPPSHGFDVISKEPADQTPPIQ